MSRVIAILLLVVCGCGGGGHPRTKVEVYGIVESGPTPGPCIVGIPCSGPARGVKLVFSRGHATFRAVSDRQGHYRVRLEPGEYKVDLAGPPGPAQIFPDHFLARTHGSHSVDFSIDTGAR